MLFSLSYEICRRLTCVTCVGPNFYIQSCCLSNKIGQPKILWTKSARIPSNRVNSIKPALLTKSDLTISIPPPIREYMGNGHVGQAIKNFVILKMYFRRKIYPLNIFVTFLNDICGVLPGCHQAAQRFSHVPARSLYGLGVYLL